jgi:hypothetical protein
MSLKDMLTYTWEKPLLGKIRDIYVDPEGAPYRRNYMPKGRRRILFPREILKELDLRAKRCDLSMLLNSTLKLFGHELDFINVEDLDNRLKNEHDSKVAEFLSGRGREYGKKYYEGLCPLIPEDFHKAYENLMMVFDIVLGTRWKDIENPRPGYAHYAYPLGQYPFERDSPSERSVWSFAQGTASKLHSRGGKTREMHASIRSFKDQNRVDITSFCSDEVSRSDFEKLKEHLKA